MTREARKLKPGDRFSFLPAAWSGPGIVTESYASGEGADYKSSLVTAY